MTQALTREAANYPRQLTATLSERAPASVKTTMKDLILRLWLLAVLALAMFPAQAQDSEAPLGVHPQGSQSHWYGERCCHLKDCARVNVRIEGDFYVWDSWLYPGEVRTVWINDPDDIHPSQDMSFHGCEYPLPPERRADQFTANPTVDGVYCLYVPPAM